MIERANSVFRSDATKMRSFRDDVSKFRRGEFSGSDLVDMLWSLCDVSAKELGTLINEVAELFEDETKRQELVKAWNNWKAIVSCRHPFLPHGRFALTPIERRLPANRRRIVAVGFHLHFVRQGVEVEVVNRTVIALGSGPPDQLGRSRGFVAKLIPIACPVQSQPDWQRSGDNHAMGGTPGTARNPICARLAGPHARATSTVGSRQEGRVSEPATEKADPGLDTGGVQQPHPLGCLGRACQQSVGRQQ